MLWVIKSNKNIKALCLELLFCIKNVLAQSTLHFKNMIIANRSILPA